MTSIAYSYRCGVSTVAKLIPEVCREIWNGLVDEYMPIPNEGKWREIAEEFNDMWNFPHCIGAIDGKHVKIKSPPNSGSVYFNYKGTFSIVLLALVDAQYRFIYLDVGSYGRNSDGGVFAYSSLGRALNSGQLQIPPSQILPNKPDLGPLPYVIIGDAAFPLNPNIMKPFPDRNITKEKRVFNYRLSRARRVVENAFGHLATRWQLYNRTLQMHPENAITIVKATCILHNLLRHDDVVGDQANPQPMPRMDLLHNLDNVRGRGTDEAIHVRESFTEYFSSQEGRVNWQEASVQRGISG